MQHGFGLPLGLAEQAECLRELLEQACPGRLPIEDAGIDLDGRPLDPPAIRPGKHGAGEDPSAGPGRLHEERPVVLPVGDVDVDIASPVLIDVKLDRQADETGEFGGDGLDMAGDVFGGIAAQRQIDRSGPLVNAARSFGLVMQHRLFEQIEEPHCPGRIVVDDVLRPLAHLHQVEHRRIRQGCDDERVFRGCGSGADHDHKKGEERRPNTHPISPRTAARTATATALGPPPSSHPLPEDTR